eukprot:tig00000269_g23743.t1
MAAAQWKERGNEFFKRGELDKAAECYGKAIELSGGQADEATFRNNRAACYVKQGKFEEALADCEEVLKREPRNLKALLRHACALENTGQPDRALAGYLRVTESERCKRGTDAFAGYFRTLGLRSDKARGHVKAAEATGMELDHERRFAEAAGRPDASDSLLQPILSAAVAGGWAALRGGAALPSFCTPLLSRAALDGCGFLRDEHVVPFLEGCPSLTALSLRDCVLLTDETLRAAGRHLRGLRSLDATNCLKMGDDGLRALAEGCPDLREVVLNRKFAGRDAPIKVTGAGLGALARSCKLERLELEWCTDVTDGCMAEVFSSCGESIRVLALGECSRITSSTLAAAGAYCPNLSALRSCPEKFCGASPIVWRAFSQNCAGLAELRLSSLSMRPDAIHPMLEACAGVTRLDLSYCRNVDDNALAIIGATCKGLVELGLRDCTRVTTEGVAALASAAPPALESADLGGLPRVSDGALVALAAVCPKLRRLGARATGVAGGSRVRGKGPADVVAALLAASQVPPSPVRLRRTRSLEELDVTSREDVADASFAPLGEELAQLRCLTLEHCAMADDEEEEDEEKIARTVLACPALEGLSAGDAGAEADEDEGEGEGDGKVRVQGTASARFTDAGVIAVAGRCGALRSLALVGAPGVTDAALAAVDDGLIDALEEEEDGGAGGACPAARLATLLLSGCRGVSGARVDGLRNRFPHVSVEHYCLDDFDDLDFDEDEDDEDEDEDEDEDDE